MGVRKYQGQILCDKRWPDGKRFKRKYPNRKQAENMLTRIDASILDGSWKKLRETLRLRNNDERVPTVAEYSQRYIEEYAKPRNKKKAWERKQTAFRAINPRLGKLNLEEVTSAHLHNYVRRRKAKVSAATINREIVTLKHMFNFAVETKVIQSNPIEKFKRLNEEQVQRKRFSEEEIAAVIAATRPKCRPMFVFMKESGCRREEAFTVTHDQVHEESRLVVFDQDTKSRKYRYVPLTDETLEAVRALPKLDQCKYVFYNSKTRDRWHDCRKAWGEARKKAGVPDLLMKDLRRHYAIKLAERGATMHDIQQVLGHASVATTEKHYAQFSPSHSAKKILRVLQGGKASGTKTELSIEKEGRVEVG